jgi:hypothetical protein
MANEGESVREIEVDARRVGRLAAERTRVVRQHGVDPDNEVG